jgi:hypothetical protein
MPREWTARRPRHRITRVEESHGQSGQLWTHVADTFTGPIQTEPACFRRVAAIRDEVQEISGNQNDLRAAAKQVCEKDRGCQSWYPYTPGFTPKEHLEELQMGLLENARRDFELRLEKDRKEFDLKLLEISQKIQEDSRKIASRSFWFNLFFTFVLIVLTLVQIFLAMDWGRATFRQLAEQLGNLLIQKMSGG